MEAYRKAELRVPTFTFITTPTGFRKVRLDFKIGENPVKLNQSTSHCSFKNKCKN